MKHLPKLELHLHLEGAAPPSFIRGLAAEKKVNLDGIFDHAHHYKFADFKSFLRTYEAATSVLTTPMDFQRLTRAVLEQSVAHGVIYTEIFLSPDFCGGGDLGAWKEYLAAIEEAAQAYRASDGIHMRGVVTCIRHLGPDRARAAARCAAETAGAFVVGFGMAGDEMVGQPSDFSYSFDMAREARLGLSVHAGEWGGAKSIRDTITALRPDRIGHGVAAAQDPALMDSLAQTGTVLEVCPGSNVALGVVPDWSAHPIERLSAAGVRVTVSTDDPPFFHTDLSSEYQHLSDTFGWETEQFRWVNEVALDAAFCDTETKDQLRKQVDRGYG